ncbi:RHS repeat-associated core domain-containing protein [Glaesserella sp.]|uniref:RHS repeat-associated core domain-containing protein n=1 Tax=Glaesserella sp. TaxID=2094731 RepID=UPI0035A1CF3B
MNILNSINSTLGNVVSGAAGALDYAADSVTNTLGMDDMYTPAVSQGSDSAASNSAFFGETAYREVLNFLNSDLKDNFDTGKDALKGIVTIAKGGNGVGLAVTAGGWLGGQAGGMAGSALMDSVLGDEFLGYTKVQDGNKPVRKDDPIFHKNSDWENIGGVLGAIVGAGAAIGMFALLTGPVGWCVVAAAFCAAFVGMFVQSFIGSCASSLSQYGEKKGQILSGAPTVTFEGKPVARVKDLIRCDDHSGPQRVAEGVTTVSACGDLVARIGHRTECDGNVQGGCDTISIDQDNTSVVLDVHPNTNLVLLTVNTFIGEFLPGPDHDSPTNKNNKPDNDSSTNKNNKPDDDSSTNKNNKPDDDSSTNKNNKPDDDSSTNKNNKPDDDSSTNKNNKPDNDSSANKDNKANDTSTGKNTDGSTNVAPTQNDKPATESATKNGTETQNTCANGDPVDMATGDFIQLWQAISLPQDVLPLNLNRLYRSTAQCKGLFGDKWADDWSQYIEINQEKKEVVYYNGEGVAYTYHTPTNDVYAFNLHTPQNLLYGKQTHYLYLFNRKEQRVYLFEHIKNAPLNRRYLTWIMDYFGNFIHLEYKEEELQTVTHSAGYKLKIASHNGLIKRIDYVTKDIQQCLLTCEYNDKRQLVHCHSHQFGDIYHEYDKNGLMTCWKDTQKTHTSVRYDEKGRVSSTQTASGHYEDRFEYDEENRCTTYTDAEGGVSRYWYNKDNLIIKVEDALGRMSETKWHFSKKVAEIDTLGRQVSYTYSRRGDLISLRLPTGKRFQYRYNRLGLLVEAVSSQGEKWQYAYSDKGALLSSISPHGLEWQYHYDKKGRLIRITYPDGNYTIYGYDEERRQVKSYCDTRGDKTTFDADIFGRLLSVTQPDGSQYRYEYSQAHANPNGSLTKIETPEGSIQTFSYNSERLLTEAIDGNGNTTRYSYGAFDLLESRTSPNGERLHFSYDKLTRLTEVKNAQGDRYTYEYDQAGQLIAETDFAGNRKTYAYDQAGRLIQRHEADTIETFQYDWEDKLLKRQSWQKADLQAVECSQKFAKNQENQTACSVLVHEVRYEYNKRGQLVKTENRQYAPFEAVHTTEFEYDDRHRLIAEIQDGKRVEIELDKFGRQTGLTLPQGAEETIRIAQGFNQYGELTQFQVNDHNPLTFQYDKLGRQTEKRSQAGFYLAERFTPSGLLQAQGGGWDNALTQEQLANYQPHHTYPIAGTQISRKWEYDNAFNLTQTQDNKWGKTEYRHNKNGQITSVINDIRSREEYHYDAQLNLTQKAVTPSDRFGQYSPQAANDSRYRIKQHHGRTVRFGNTTYKYDELGRLKTKTETKPGFRPVSTYYKWNSQSQLVELISPHNGTWRYEYDSFGRRISKYQVPTENQPTATDIPVKLTQRYWRNYLQNVDPQAVENEENFAKHPPKPTACKGTQFVYHHNQLVAEVPLTYQTDGSSALEPQANWDEAIYWLYQDDDFSPTARYEKGQLHYTVTDQIGTITELMTEDGYIDYRQKLDLWGEAEIDGYRHHAANDSTPLKCNHRFAGQYYDDESGLHYNRFRYYSPETGQYVSHDPIGLLGGFNPYGYVFDPTGWIDPLGLAVCPVLKDKYNEARARGMTASDAYAVAKGRTVDISTGGRTPEEIASLREYATRSNEWLAQSGPQTIQSTKGGLRNQASRAARTERRRAERAGMPYQGQAGHVPDTAVTGMANPPGGWLDMAGVSNNAAGGLLGSRVGQRIDFYTIDGVKP